jgi:hypothetical protein
VSPKRGRLPSCDPRNAFGDIGAVANNDGTPQVLKVKKVKDVPVNAFWSVIVCNADGFIPENSRGVYGLDNVR